MRTKTSGAPSGPGTCLSSVLTPSIGGALAIWAAASASIILRAAGISCRLIPPFVALSQVSRGAASSESNRRVIVISFLLSDRAHQHFTGACPCAATPGWDRLYTSDTVPNVLAERNDEHKTVLLLS